MSEELLFEKRVYSSQAIRFVERFGGVLYLTVLFLAYIVFFEYTPFIVINHLQWHRKFVGIAALHS